jgi:hypothetical protein
MANPEDADSHGTRGHTGQVKCAERDGVEERIRVVEWSQRTDVRMHQAIQRNV